jgi:hypothetical protein
MGTWALGQKDSDEVFLRKCRCGCSPSENICKNDVVSRQILRKACMRDNFEPISY